MSMFGEFLRRTDIGYAHYCPACAEMHHIAVDKPQRNGAIWQFNGDAIFPTFNPSINISVNNGAERCHYYIVAGNIKYQSDCTHVLAGRIIPLPYIAGYVT